MATFRDRHPTIGRFVAPRSGGVFRSLLARLIGLALVIALSVLLGLVTNGRYGGLEFGIVVGLPVFALIFGIDFYFRHGNARDASCNEDR
jgi:uncharacterized membrane protein